MGRAAAQREPLAASKLRLERLGTVPMQVVVTKKDLERVLSRCQGVADKKSTMPVLGNVLLESHGKDSLRLAATDLTLAVSGTVSARVDRPGSVAIGAKELFERVRAMPDGEVSIGTNDAQATIVRSVGGARRYTLHGVPGEEFPSLPEADRDSRAVRLGVNDMARLIGATHFSISADDTRHHLNSALFEQEGDRLRMVTTDGHRLSKLELAASVPIEGSTSLLIPRKGVLELKRLCDEAESREEELELVQSGPNAIFRLRGFQFSVKLVDAQFPPYQQVIPATASKVIKAPRLELQDALRAVRLAASDRTGGVRLTVANNALRIESESPESGAGFDEIAVDYDGKEVTIGFNANYVLDVLGSIEHDDVELSVSGALDPVVLRPVAEGTPFDYVAVVMPMRI